MKIKATYVANIIEYASYKGISEVMLRNHLIEKKLDLCNQDMTVTFFEYQNVFKALMSATKDKDFGIHYGSFLNLKALGFIVQISLNTTSIQQAVFILKNYLANTFPVVRIEDRLKETGYILSLTCEIEEAKLKKQFLDFVFCFIYRELKLILPIDSSLTIELPDSSIGEMKKLINDKITKGKGYKFMLPKTVLNTEINVSKVKQIEILLPKFLQLINTKKHSLSPFSVQIRNMILNLCKPEIPNFEQVATHFPFSIRTIQRKLSNENSSFRMIADGIKNELSIYLSKGYKMKTQEIAYLLGYSEASSYLHAVKKWQKS